MSAAPCLGIDVGGTFTDAVLFRGGSDPVAVKVPTTDPPDTGVIEAARLACSRGGLRPTVIGHLRHGSTVATNALIERGGATTALVTTEGFRDVLEIGRQDRPVMYDLTAERPPPLVPRDRRIEIDERTPPPGHPQPDRIRRPPDLDALERVVGELASAEAVAVCLLHSDVDPRHERTVVEHLDGRLDVPVVGSADIDGTVREYERTATTVASAALTPVLEAYLGRLVDDAASLGLPSPAIMQSNGGVADVHQVLDRAVTAVLSGPAAGVVGATAAVGAVAPAETTCITLDMGGTSADVCVVEEGTPTKTTDTVVAGVPLRVPAVDIHTVGAGGGSIARIDEGGALRVGPASAGADPGPACYGRGGTDPTVTDAALVLGLLDADRPLGGGLHLDRGRSRSVMTDLADAGGLEGPTAAAAGVIRVATETMAQAIRHVTVERGHDPRGDLLVAFGGAGGMFAAAVADRLGIRRVAMPTQAGVLSAVGLVATDERHDAASGVHRPLAEAEYLEACFEELESTVLERCSDPARATVSRFADLRFAGQSYELRVPIGSPVEEASAADQFRTVHRKRRGYALDDRIDAITCRVEAVVPSAEIDLERPVGDADPVDHREVTVPPAAPAMFAVYDAVPPVGATTPAVIEREHDTLVVPPGWTVERASPAVVIERGSDR